MNHTNHSSDKNHINHTNHSSDNLIGKKYFEAFF